MVKAYSYTRVSRKEQVKGTGPIRQSDGIHEYCKENGLVLDDDIYVDDGVSSFRGRNSTKGRLADFLDKVGSGGTKKGERLIIENFDRLSRMPPIDAIEQFLDIINSGLTIVTLHDKLVWNRQVLIEDSSRLFAYLNISLRAHEESKRKSERLSKSWHYKRLDASTKIMTKRSPAWMKWKDGTFSLIEDRCNVIKRIFLLSAKGHGEHKIAQMFNMEGLNTWGDTNKKAPATMWRKSYISKIIHSEAVLGTLVPKSTLYDDGKKHVITHDKVPAYYPRVISDELWNQVVSIKETASSQRGRHSKHSVENILGGLARCKHCGSSMTRVMKGAVSKAGVPKLVCTSAKTGKGCRYAPIRQDIVEKVVKRLINSDFQAADQDHYGTSVAWQTNIHREELAEIKPKLEALTDTFMKTNNATILAAIEALAERENKLKDLIRTIENLAIGYSGESLHARLKRLVQAFEEPEIDRENINSIMRTIYKQVIIDVQKGEFDFEFHNGIRSSESVVPITLSLPPGMSAETAKAKLMAAFRDTKPV